MSTQNKPIKNLTKLTSSTGLNFKNLALLEQALTHSSFAKQNRHHHLKDNERLEFFGDAILKFVVTEYLFHHFPEKSEGELSKIRAQIISDATLAVTAKSLQLSDYIYVSYSEEKTGGTTKNSILADTTEALIGAYFLDQGIKQVKQFIVTEIIEKKLTDIEANPITDYKSALQEIIQKEAHSLPLYTIIKEEGPDHDKEFTISVTYTLKSQSHSFNGKGHNKKEAEQDAAKKAYRSLNKEGSK